MAEEKKPAKEISVESAIDWLGLAGQLVRHETGADIYNVGYRWSADRCPICRQTDPQNMPEVFILWPSGNFKCDLCERRGDLEKFIELYSNRVVGRIASAWNPVLKNNTELPPTNS